MKNSDFILNYEKAKNVYSIIDVKTHIYLKKKNTKRFRFNNVTKLAINYFFTLL